VVSAAVPGPSFPGCGDSTGKHGGTGGREELRREETVDSNASDRTCLMIQGWLLRLSASYSNQGAGARRQGGEESAEEDGQRVEG